MSANREISSLRGEIVPDLVSAIVQAFGADPSRFPDVASQVHLHKGEDGVKLELVSGGDSLQIALPTTSSEPLVVADTKDGFGRMRLYGFNGDKVTLSGRWRQVATGEEFDSHDAIESGHAEVAINETEIVGFLAVYEKVEAAFE